MSQMETFAIAAFRSRSSVQRFQMALRQKRVPCAIISTPKDVAVGCGLSVRFSPAHLQEAMAQYHASGATALIGFYIVERIGGRTVVKPVGAV